MTTLKDILALLLVLACYGIAGRLDYDDALRHEEFTRGISAEGRVCPHERPSTSAEAPPVNRGGLAAVEPDRDCETTPL